MPTETAPATAGAIRARRVLRLAFGTALALWISQAGGWTLSFIAPVLTLTLLGLPLSRPPLKFFLVAFGALVISIYGSFLLLPLLLHQRLAGLLVLAVVLFHCFYFTARGGAAVIGTFLTIGITLTVAMGSVSVDALMVVAQGASVGALVGIAIAWISHLLLPDLAPPVAPPAPLAPNPLVARYNALRSLAIVLPIAVWFLVSPASIANVAVMIKVAAMGQEAATVPSRQLARSLLVSTAAGGLAAVVGWQVLSIWPSLTLYTLVVALAGLTFGVRIFEGRGVSADSATWSYGLLTMLVVLAPAVLDGTFGSDASARFYDRLLMFVGAVLYGCAAIYVYDAVRGRRPSTSGASGGGGVV